MKDFSQEIWAYALHNALEFGAADVGRILPKLFNHGLERAEIPEVKNLISDIVSQVNKLSVAERTAKFAPLETLVKKADVRAEGTLAELPNAGSHMVFRMAPFPSGALHLGNAKTFLLNALYAEKYNATLLLVIDDTIGSEEKQPLKEGYDLIAQAAELLGVHYKKPIVYKSDRLETYYEYAEKLIAKGKAYVCHCAQEQLRDNRAKGIECGCRQYPPEIQKKRWNDMFKANEGSTVLRIKTNMQHPNPAFRDRVLFKISDREHPRVGKKYRVWPALEMTWAIDDHLLGITHILRGNELMIETDMEKYIWDIFGWKHPITIHSGLIKLEGMGAKLSKSKNQKEIREGTYTGWDDPRTWSIQSLIRRGITKEAIRTFVQEIGLNKQDITVPIEALYAANRRGVDAQAARYYFVPDPIKLALTGSVPPAVGIPMHPERPEVRMVQTGPEIALAKSDYTQHKGAEVRLLHLCNAKITNSLAVTSLENKKLPKIQWVAQGIAAEVLMPDGTRVSGLVEPSVMDCTPGSIIQFERFGFVRCDSVENEKLIFWYAHP